MSFLSIRNIVSVSARQIIKNLIKIVCDLSAILLAFYIASYIVLFPPEDRLFTDSLVLVFIALFNSYFLVIHNHLWRTISFYNFRHIAKYAISICVLYIVWCTFYNSPSEELFKFSFVFLLLSFSLLSLTRICVRLVNEKNKILNADDKTKIILIGAGKGGELFLRESRKKQQSTYEIEGILDDDPELWGKRVFGHKVYGPIKDLAKLASSGDVDTVTIAIPSIDRNKLLEITQVCEELNLHVKILPSFAKLITVSDLYPEHISVENLLGRESIDLKNEEVFSFIRNKTIMVTGAGGSIGSEVCRQIIELQPKKLILVDHSEHNLYCISWDLEHKFNFNKHVPCIGSVTDYNLMENIFEEHKPDIVFHAAAYKHVPLLEGQAKQAIQNNFFGTKNVAELASKNKSEKFILISTDKAVNSTNIMGTSKRMAELYCQYLNDEGNTKFITVRFGNVLDSAGSVVPLFKKQLKQGGPITVTHPEITRFFMSIPEASQLVLEASAMGKGGEIYVLDMGEPVKIVTLAERLITLSGKRPYKDIDIVYTGLRPGEKLYEELFYTNEEHIPTTNKKILLAQTKSTKTPKIVKTIPALESCIAKNDIAQLLEAIKAIVPEANICSEGGNKQAANSF